jgi:zinc transport system substrate-binding protein
MKFSKVAVQIILLFFLFLIFPLSSYGEKKFTVYTVNYPLAYFAGRIGENLIDVVFPAPPDIDPAFWVPDEAMVRKYQRADLIILNGAGYAKWTEKVSLPMARSVDTSRSFRDTFLQIESSVTHNHGPSGDHSHGGTAFTTWLDFSQAALQAEAIYKALIRKLPAQKDILLENFKALQAELRFLDEQLLALSEKRPELPLFASHPIYQYMARHYKMDLKMLMWEPDADPGNSEWKHLEELSKSHPAKWMIWEGGPISQSVEKLRDLGIQGQVFSPCFAVPPQGTFLSVMQQNIDNMKTIFN